MMEKNDVLHIICDMCHRSLPYTEFPSKSKIGTGKTIICKGCVNIKNSKQPKLDEIPLFGAYKNVYVGAGNLELNPDEVFMKIVKAPKYYVSNYGRVIQKGRVHDDEVESVNIPFDKCNLFGNSVHHFRKSSAGFPEGSAFDYSSSLTA